MRAVALATRQRRPVPVSQPLGLSAQPGMVSTVLDGLGRPVATAPADARGTALLPGGLAPGVYVVRAGQ